MADITITFPAATIERARAHLQAVGHIAHTDEELRPFIYDFVTAVLLNRRVASFYDQYLDRVDLAIVHVEAGDPPAGKAS